MLENQPGYLCTVEPLLADTFKEYLYRKTIFEAADQITRQNYVFQTATSITQNLWRNLYVNVNKGCKFRHKDK